jgi:PKD repeat protein
MSYLRRCIPAAPTTMLAVAVLLAGVTLVSPAPASADDFTWSPTSPNIGQAVTFTSTVYYSTMRWTFDQQGCSPSADAQVITPACLMGTCFVTFHFASPGTHSVMMSAPGTGTGCTSGYCPKASHTLTVANAGSCGATSAPTAPVLSAPVAGTQVSPGNVAFSWQASTGTAPISYVVKYCSQTICPSQSTTTCSANLATPGTCDWYVTASNSVGSADSLHRSLTVQSSCTATAAPVASFTYSPSTPVTVGGVTQNRPYEGQTVTFTDTSTNSPTAWDWTDFGVTPAAHLTLQNPNYVWSTTGDKAVRLAATNCKGTSPQVSQTVHVWPDVRPVTAQFLHSPDVGQTGQEVTFGAVVSDATGNPNRFTWDFGDGSTPVTGSQASVTHVYTCARVYPVSLVASRVMSTTVTSPATTVNLTVGGTSCAPAALLIMDVARHAPGVGTSVWNTDVKFYNSTADDMILKIRYQLPGAGTPNESPSFLLHADEVRTLESVLAELAPHWIGYVDFTKASVWLYHASVSMRGSASLPVVSARTHTGAAPTYDDYGMMLPVLSVVAPSSKSQVLYILGAEHNGKTAQQQLRGFRTNLTVVEPNGTGFAAGKVNLTLLREDDPSYVKKQALVTFAPFQYMAQSIPTYFVGVGVDDDLGPIIIKIEVAANTAVAIGGSLVTNATNDPATLSPIPLE